MSGRGFADVAADVLRDYVREILVPRKRYTRIRELVTSIEYLAAKARRIGPERLAEDVRAARRLAPDHEAAAQLRELETAVMQASRLIAEEPAQLYGQLLIRLPRGIAFDLDKLLDDAERWRDRTWLRPLSAKPGEPFLRSFGPVSGSARAVAISDNAAVVLVGTDSGGL